MTPRAARTLAGAAALLLAGTVLVAIGPWTIPAQAAGWGLFGLGAGLVVGVGRATDPRDLPKVRPLTLEELRRR